MAWGQNDLGIAVTEIRTYCNTFWVDVTVDKCYDKTQEQRVKHLLDILWAVTPRNMIFVKPIQAVRGEIRTWETFWKRIAWLAEKHERNILLFFLFQSVSGQMMANRPIGNAVTSAVWSANTKRDHCATRFHCPLYADSLDCFRCNSHDLMSFCYISLFLSSRRSFM